MSICLESNSVIATTAETQISTAPAATVEQTDKNVEPQQQTVPLRTIAKLPVSNAASLSKASVITVLNTPLGNVKTLCVTPAVSSNNAPGQFTVTPLNVTNSSVKPQTITLINTPVTVVKTIPPNVEKGTQEAVTNNNPVSTAVPTLIENRGHNVFVKNTPNADNQTQEIPQSHKILTANNFPTNNVLTTALNVTDKMANGQRNKVKILSNIVMPGSSHGANFCHKQTVNNPQRYISRPKIVGPNNNGVATKYLNKPPNNILNKSQMNILNKQPPPPPGTHRVLYPTHKSQLKTLPPVNNYVHSKPPGIKTLPPQPKGMPGQIQRTGSGLRTIPPQRPPKLPNKPNYIGKHAVQAQKMKPPHKLKSLKPNQMYNSYHSLQMPEKQLTFNQALTAEILETLGSKSSGPYPIQKNYEILPPSRYDSGYYTTDIKPTFANDVVKTIMEEPAKSGLDTLSLICQAVLLDHNYNATLPPDSPTRPLPIPNTPAQINGVSSTSMYSPGASAGKRRTLSSSNPISASTSLTTLSAVASNSNSLIGLQADDAGSDLSDSSDRKHDTEGEETDTAPEAEAVNNEDAFGDYVTRCLCGYIHDDGYMVQCDTCKVWQHVVCVLKNKQVPDDYYCEVCDPRKFIDRQRARMIQQQWLKERELNTDPKLLKDKPKPLFRQKEPMSDSDTSDGEHPRNVKPRPPMVNRRKSDGRGGPRQRRDLKEMVQRRQIKKREKKVTKRKSKLQMKINHHSDDENNESSSMHIPQLRQWIENYEEAVTNHYSPELRARISNIRVNGAHTDVPTQYDPSVHKCRVHSQPLTELKYLVSTVLLPPNSPVIELRGKYMLSAQHRNSGSSFNTRQHSQRPGPFLFFYRLHKDNTEVCVDTRTYGNSARFIRRSCKPNAELRHTIVKGVLHLYIVTIIDVDKNVELTIKHESHDLAAIGTTHISCACGNPDECTVNRTSIKKNGESTEIHKKKRGRRTTSLSLPEAPEVKKEVVQSQMSPPIIPKQEETEIKQEVEEEIKPEVKEEIEKPEIIIKVEEPVKEEKVEEVVKEETIVLPPPVQPPPSVVATRRSSAHHKTEKEEPKEIKEECSPPSTEKKNKKLSREERKLEAILRAIEQMEKKNQRKQEHQAKQAHRRESEPAPGREEDKCETKARRRRRKGRARTASTHTPINRRNRLNSTDSYMTSGDETLLSPNDHPPPNRPHLDDQSDKDAGLLLALSNGDKDNTKSPGRELDSNSNSAHSSPETHLSPACLLVQAAVEPMEHGFKFPKTKKGLMNEWLNKAPEPVHPATFISPSSLSQHINSSGSDYESNSSYYNPGKSLAALAQVASFCDSNTTERGSAKKRWLRQAISEDQCDSPSGRGGESPPISEALAPPKKRRLPRESLSNDITPPTTPTGLVPPLINIERQQSQESNNANDLTCSGADDDDSPSQAQLESDEIIDEQVVEMRDLEKCDESSPPQAANPSLGCLLDPRLSREHRSHQLFTNSDHLVGTVEKTLSIFGFQDRKPEPITPQKRKLSITEYRQRKKLNNNDKCLEEHEHEQNSPEENNSLEESFKPMRHRSDSTSSCTSITSSDEEIAPLELPEKALSAFNSEPTELERQREITSLRLKKAFGIPVDEDVKKPALDVETLLNCEIPTVVKTMPPSPTFPIPGSCDSAVNLTLEKDAEEPPSPKTMVEEEKQMEEVPIVVEHEEEEKMAEEEQDEDNSNSANVHLFYTPDEEEHAKETPSVSFEEVESVEYVPPFNNPIYPNSSDFTAFTSVIDDDARYEGRNPSPPPDLQLDNQTFQRQPT